MAFPAESSIIIFSSSLELEKQERQENCSFISNITNIMDMDVNNSEVGSHIFVKRVQWNWNGYDSVRCLPSKDT